MSDHFYPLVTYSFTVDWGGTQIGFTEISGLDFEADVIEYRHGASPEYSKIKMPGQVKYPDIVAKRGTFTGDNQFYAWWNTIKQSSVERRDITIALLNEDRVPVIVWKARNAWAKKVQSTGLKADGSEVAIESIEIAHEGLSVQND